MKRLVAVFAFTALSALFLFAQGRGATPAEMIANRIARLTTLLTLTTDQQTQATAIFTKEQAGESSLITSMQAARKSLQSAIQTNDAAGIATLATQIGALTTEQVADQARADAAFYAILTADQQAKYNELQSAGPGGPGGPGGFGGLGPARFGAPRLR
jgi:Spy/CpxP family protein refolding chaperone